MRRTMSWHRCERGSVLLGSMIAIFLMTLLGVALFDLGVIEGRLVYVSQDDARAFEIAQTGLERALFKLKDTFNNDPTNPHNWAGPTGASLCSGGGHRGCSDGQFYPADTGYISNLNFDSGSYAIEFKQVTAQTLSIPCAESTETSDVDATKKICKDLIFVRITGALAPTANASAGARYTASRAVQLLVQPIQVPGACLICGGLTGAAATGSPINGNVNIAGSIWIAGKDGTTSLSLGGGAGQTNSYAALDSQSLARVAKLPLVCPFGTTCTTSSQLVESLGATLKIERPQERPRVVPDVALSGSAALGQNGNQTYSADATRKGKGPLDGILVADGCIMPCTDNFGGVTLNSNVFVDDNDITKRFPCPQQSSPCARFPLLTGAWYVNISGNPTQFTHLACPLGSSCTAPTTPPTVPSGTSEFFVSRAANVMVSGNCTDTVGGTGCDPIINSLGSTTGLTDGTAAFRTVVRFFDQTNTYMKAMICWQRTRTCNGTGTGCGASGLAMPVNTLEFGQPIADSTSTPPGSTWLSGGGCDTPAPSSAPLLLYFPSTTPATTGFNVQRVGGPTDYNYRGSAMVLTNGLVQMEERFQTCQTATGSACFNSHGFGGGDLFTRDSSLTVMTWGGNSGVCAGSASCGNMYLADSTSNVDRIMGLFYAGCAWDPTDPSNQDPKCAGNPTAATPTKGFLRSRKQTNTVGAAQGSRLCFAGGSSPCPSGGNVPSFFQVTPDVNNFVATIVQTPGGSYTVVPVSRYWVECKRTFNADGTYAALPTGSCTYTP